MFRPNWPSSSVQVSLSLLRPTFQEELAHLKMTGCYHLRCRSLYVNRRFVGTLPPSSGPKISRGRNKFEEGFWFLARLIFYSKHGDVTSPKRRFTIGLHGAISQKVAAFMAATLRTSYPVDYGQLGRDMQCIYLQ
jgi:hypothetical protein